MATELPAPECDYGYTHSQVEQVLGDRESEFRRWMEGQTAMLCGGLGPCRGVAHGVVFFAWDVERFLDGRPIID